MRWDESSNGIHHLAHRLVTPQLMRRAARRIVRERRAFMRRDESSNNLGNLARWLVTPQLMRRSVRQRVLQRPIARLVCVPAAFGASLLACGAPPVPDPAHVTVGVELQRAIRGVSVRPVQVKGVAGEIRVYGEIIGTLDRVSLAPELTRAPRGYRLRILEKTNGSYRSFARLHYMVTLGDLPARDYRMVVVLGRQRLDTLVTVR
jgi:hypothetical protein